MWLIIGLGNPGKAYARTRHNLGLLTVDAVSSKYSISCRHKQKHYVYGRGMIEGKKTILIKPLTFMNKSGLAVRDALNRNRDIKTVVVVHDDLDLSTGIIRIKKSGSSGGHKGIESIIEQIGTKDFLRVKIGIGRPERGSAEEYVLSTFSRQERPLIKSAIENSVEAVALLIMRGLSSAQNKFHKA
jgi:PTH1 family peptidyl-tRNA hydrolase